MPKQSQVLEIEPKNEICFKGPFTQTVTEYFKLTNPTSKKIAFKVKTTAPKRYCVRPNNGSINPGQTVSIAVMLQATDGTIVDKHKHKFMIQSVEAPEGEFNHEELFKSADPSTIMDSKFKCVFDDPNEQNNSYENRNHENIASDRAESETLKSRFGDQSKATKALSQQGDSGHFSAALSNEQDARGAAEDGDFSGEELNDNIIDETRATNGRLKDETPKSEAYNQYSLSSGVNPQTSQRPVGGTTSYIRPSKLDESSSVSNTSHNVSYSKPSMVQTQEVALEEGNLYFYIALAIVALVIGFVLGKIF